MRAPLQEVPLEEEFKSLNLEEASVQIGQFADEIELVQQNDGEANIAFCPVEKNSFGLRDAVNTLKENLPHPKIVQENQVFAYEVGSFLWASGLMDRVVGEALADRLKTEQVVPQLRTGLHYGSPRIWNNFSHFGKKD